MTKWDAGQDLIACFDLLSEKARELDANGYATHAAVLREAREPIADLFNRIGSHAFMLPVADLERGRDEK